MSAEYPQLIDVSAGRSDQQRSVADETIADPHIASLAWTLILTGRVPTLGDGKCVGDEVGGHLLSIFAARRRTIVVAVVVVIVALAGLIGGLVGKSRTHPLYESTAVVMVLPPGAGNPDAKMNPFVNLDNNMIQLALALTTALNSPRTVADLGEPDSSIEEASAATVKTSAGTAGSGDTVQIAITAQGTDPGIAQATVERLTTYAKTALTRMQTDAGVRGRTFADLLVVTRASAPEQVSASAVKAIGTMALLFMIVAGVVTGGILALIDFLLRRRGRASSAPVADAPAEDEDSALDVPHRVRDAETERFASPLSGITQGRKLSRPKLPALRMPRRPSATRPFGAARPPATHADAMPEPMATTEAYSATELDDATEVDDVLVDGLPSSDLPTNDLQKSDLHEILDDEYADGFSADTEHDQESDEVESEPDDVEEVESEIRSDREELDFDDLSERLTLGKSLNLDSPTVDITLSPSQKPPAADATDEQPAADEAVADHDAATTYGLTSGFTPSGLAPNPMGPGDLIPETLPTNGFGMPSLHHLNDAAWTEADAEATDDAATDDPELIPEAAESDAATETFDGGHPVDEDAATPAVRRRDDGSTPGPGSRTRSADRPVFRSVSSSHQQSRTSTQSPRPPHPEQQREDAPRAEPQAEPFEPWTGLAWRSERWSAGTESQAREHDPQPSTDDTDRDSDSRSDSWR